MHAWQAKENVRAFSRVGQYIPGEEPLKAHKEEGKRGGGSLVNLGAGSLAPDRGSRLYGGTGAA